MESRKPMAEDASFMRWLGCSLLRAGGPLVPAETVPDLRKRTGKCDKEADCYMKDGGRDGRKYRKP